MALLTDEQVQAGQINYAAIDQITGKFIVNKKVYSGISGRLLGFNSHEFLHNGKMQKKFDIFLEDNGTVYQVQLGYNSYVTQNTINSMLNLVLTSKPKVTLIAFKNDEGKYDSKVVFEGKPLPWKYKWEELKYNGKTGDAKEAHRLIIINKWYEALTLQCKFNPDEIKPQIPDEVPAAAIDDNDDLPF